MTENNYPYYILADKFRDFIDFFSEELGCPKNYLLGPMISAVSIVLGKKVFIRFKSYKNYPNLMIAIVGRPGMNKSQPLKLCLGPVFDLDNEVIAAAKEDRRNAELQNDLIKKHNKGLPPMDRTPYVPLPGDRALTTTDSTPERRNELLHNMDETKYSLTIYFDELAGMFDQFGRYNNSSELRDIIQLYDGGRYKVDRKGEGTMVIKNPKLGIIGTIQTDTMKEIFKKKELLDSGFSYRWIFFDDGDFDIPPISCTSNYRRAMELRGMWDSFIKDLFHQRFGVMEDDPFNPDSNVDDTPDKNTDGQCYVFTPDAFTEYVRWANVLRMKENYINKSNKDELRYASLMSKAQITILKLMLCIHFMTNYGQSNQICKEEVLYAEAFFDRYFEECKWLHSSDDSTAPKGVQQKDENCTLYNEYMRAKENGINATQFAEIKGISRRTLFNKIDKFKQNSAECKCNYKN